MSEAYKRPYWSITWDILSNPIALLLFLLAWLIAYIVKVGGKTFFEDITSSYQWPVIIMAIILLSILFRSRAAIAAKFTEWFGTETEQKFVLGGKSDLFYVVWVSITLTTFVSAYTTALGVSKFYIKDDKVVFGLVIAVMFVLNWAIWKFGFTTAQGQIIPGSTRLKKFLAVLIFPLEVAVVFGVSTTTTVMGLSGENELIRIEFGNGISELLEDLEKTRKLRNAEPFVLQNLRQQQTLLQEKVTQALDGNLTGVGGKGAVAHFLTSTSKNYGTIATSLAEVTEEKRIESLKQLTALYAKVFKLKEEVNKSTAKEVVQNRKEIITQILAAYDELQKVLQESPLLSVRYSIENMEKSLVTPLIHKKDRIAQSQKAAINSLKKAVIAANTGILKQIEIPDLKRFESREAMEIIFLYAWDLKFQWLFAFVVDCFLPTIIWYLFLIYGPALTHKKVEVANKEPATTAIVAST
ncbi:MAG: hypothetical protein OXR68_00830 [Alphaproteobacteria bacterium]|nr:hypothetical protein [Alphaproteobacteria bacterium]